MKTAFAAILLTLSATFCAQAQDYHLEVLRWRSSKSGGPSSGWQLIRWNSRTGQAWYSVDDVQLQSITDPLAIPESEYVVKGVEYGDGEYQAVRVDSKSGKTWRLKGWEWLEMKEARVNKSPDLVSTK